MAMTLCFRRAPEVSVLRRLDVVLWMEARARRPR
jgi:hypothetical protein